MWIRKKEIERLSEFVKGFLSGEEAYIRNNKEGAFSVLKNDIYSLVTTKNEQLKATEAERDILAEYMADISHQLTMKMDLESFTVPRFPSFLLHALSVSHKTLQSPWCFSHY